MPRADLTWPEPESYPILRTSGAEPTKKSGSAALTSAILHSCAPIPPRFLLSVPVLLASLLLLPFFLLHLGHLVPVLTKYKKIHQLFTFHLSIVCGGGGGGDIMMGSYLVRIQCQIRPMACSENIPQNVRTIHHDNGSFFLLQFLL